MSPNTSTQNIIIAQREEEVTYARAFFLAAPLLACAKLEA
jgi:hypothetical protein